MGDMLNKMQEMAGKAINKTGEAIDVGKCKMKITGQKSEIADLKKKLGEYIYEQYKDCDDEKEMDKEVLEMCENIKSLYEEIVILEEKMEK